jgi:hypothetical protein
MDPETVDSLVKAAPVIAKGVTAVGAAIPFTAIVKRMLGPAADELAEMWRDQVRMYRYERQLKCVVKAEKMAQEAGFTPQAVPPKVLFPLLEGASLEDDENLHDMWASLLANAASPKHPARTKPEFIGVLRMMSSEEAGVLRWMADYDGLLNNTLSREQIVEAYRELGFETGDLDIVLNGLEASKLISSSRALHFNKEFEDIDYGIPSFSVTPRGRVFVEACQPPAPQRK